MTKPLDLTGKRFGRWVTVRRGSNTKAGKTTYLCACDCGTEREVVSSSLIGGKSISCGCNQIDVVTARNTTHGMVGSSEYGSWQMMLARCRNANFPDYDLYGGRGISVCERWLKFENFFSDMGKKPEGKTSIDRIDVNGDYEPNNCRWASQKEQMNNVRKNRHVAIGGVVMTIADAARYLGMPYGKTMWRVTTGQIKEVQP